MLLQGIVTEETKPNPVVLYMYRVPVLHISYTV